jgi:hypothetical protein
MVPVLKALGCGHARTLAGRAVLVCLIWRLLHMLLRGETFGGNDRYQDSPDTQLTILQPNETGLPAVARTTNNNDKSSGGQNDLDHGKHWNSTAVDAFSEQDCTFWSGPNKTRRSRYCTRRCSSSVINFRNTTEEGRWCRKKCPSNCEWFPLERKDRFPTVEDRVKLYMHHWYHPCKQQFKYTRDDSGPYPILRVRGDDFSNETIFDAVIDADKMLLLDRPFLEDCARSRRDLRREKRFRTPALSTSKYIFKRESLRTYCSSVQDLVEINDQLNAKYVRSTPLVSSFGDIMAIDRNNNRVPLIGKWRKAMTRQELERLTSTSHCQDHDLKAETAPVIWKLESIRHWDPIEPSILEDTAWEKKKASVTWRGAFTGRAHHKTSDSKKTELEHCRQNQRCSFVLDHANSKLIDAGLDSTVGLISDVVSGVNITKGRLSMADIQCHKVIISLEGNDVASGLKWSLMSQSVVLMPTPTRTSWAMEELLEPWVHYIPMNDDGSNAEEMVQWVIDNDQKAKLIAQRATLFMYDLLYHPDAERENGEVNEEIVRRYQEWWL